MHYFISEHGNQERRSCNHDNSRPAGHVVVHSIKKLSADYCVDRGPADASQYIEDGNDLDGIVAEEESREDHLAQPEFGTEGREEADGEDAEDVDEEYGQDSVDETEEEDWLSQRTDCEGRHHPMILVS